MSKLRPIFKCHGGKAYQYNWIISNFPKNYTELMYCEPFIGGGSVYLNKLPSKQEYIADLDPEIFDIYYDIKNLINEISDALNSIEYTEENFHKAKNREFYCSVNDIVIRRFSRGGLGKAFSWSNRKRGGEWGEVNSWNTWRKLLPEYHKRLQNTNIWNIDIVGSLLHTKDVEDILIYLDPPYLLSTRTAKKCYEHEMSESQHIIMLGYALLQKGKVIISGYDSDLYNNLLKDWNKESIEIANHSGQNKKKQKRVECLWKNF